MSIVSSFMLLSFRRDQHLRQYHHLPDNPLGISYFKDYKLKFTISDLDFNRPTNNLMKRCLSGGVKCLNLLEKIPSKQKMKILLQGDDHLSPLGHQVMSDHLLEFIQNTK